MVDHVCAVLVLACPDRDHAASRYGQMLRMLSKKLEQLDASVSSFCCDEQFYRTTLTCVQAVPSRFPSPEPQAMSVPPTDIPWNLDIPTHNTLQNPFQMTPISSGLDSLQTNSHNNIDQHMNPNQIQTNNFDPFAGMPSTGADDLFNFDVDVRFDLDGFWEDFTLGEGSGFPFR